MVGSDVLDQTLQRHNQNDFCIKMGSRDRHFNVALLTVSEGQSHKTVSTAFGNTIFAAKPNRLTYWVVSRFEN